MKSRPILFSAPMVRALLDGRKTQTRRIVKPQPVVNGFAFNKATGQISCHCDYLPPDCLVCGDDHAQPFLDGVESRCPYGQPGDRLWVKETWRTDRRLDDKAPSQFSGWPVRYEADGKVLAHGSFYGETNGKTRVSIHMPRWASRITLEITGIRCERLQEISEEDAKAEGATNPGCFPWADRANEKNIHGYRLGFLGLWEQIKGTGSWCANPWVWVVSFHRVKP